MADYISTLTGTQMDEALLDMAFHTSEAYALGTRNGEAVTSGDETYHNNAKYYAEQAGRVVPEGQAAVRYDIAQALTDSEKAQARSNINTPSDTELLDLKMLGWTVPRDFAVQNYEENGVFHQRVGRVDLGDLNYSVAQGSTFLTQNARVVGSTQFSCNKYAFNDDPRITANSSADTYLSNMQMSYRHGTNDRIYIKNTNYTTVADFKASLRGIYLYYELTTEITRPIDGGEWVARYSNPNLLDNPFFTINQRGISGAVSSGAYVADRWFVYGASNSRSGNTIIINGISSFAYVRQTIDDTLRDNLIGKSATISFKLDNGNIYTHTFKYLQGGVQNTHRMSVLGNGYVDIDLRTLGNIKIVVDGVSIGIVAVKVEYGLTPTLANDSAPNPATELMRCMRYFQVLPPFYVNGYDIWPTGIDMYTPLLVPMRTVPSAIFPTTLTDAVREIGNKNITPTSMRMGTQGYQSNKHVNIIIDSTNLVAGRMYSIIKEIQLTADL